MRIHAFQGFRFGAAAGPDPGALAAPPFDQIGPEEARRLHALDPCHFAHLTRPAAGDGQSPAAHAAKLHAAWRDGGRVERDAEPSLYPYEILLAGGGRRLGLAALVEIEDPGSVVIRPHEHTVPKTVAERLELLRALEVDLEPILLLSQDGGRLDPLLEREIAAGEPLAEHREADGHRHRLFRVAGRDRLRPFQEALAPSQAVIADGHHRYRVGQLYAEAAGAAPGTAAGSKLAVVTSLASPGLAIDPIHRLLPDGLPAGDLAGLVVRRRQLSPGGGDELARAVAEAPQPAVAVWDPARERRPELWRLDPEAGTHRLAPAASRLAVVLLHLALLPRCGMPEEAATDGRVRYRSDPEALYRAVADGAGAGIWLPPMSPEIFGAAVADGDLLPPKSTRFLPKLASGLVWAGHDTELA